MLVLDTPLPGSKTLNDLYPVGCRASGLVMLYALLQPVQYLRLLGS